ncbi:MAG TPA: alpha/beta fold hydrolase, partial [Thermoanaerobaculia bacterium]|nr:alpha/beta fold hydrolase [Thermoanaerobaculia bacterium]
MTRDALVAAGLERVEHDGSVYFRGGLASGPALVLLHGANDQAGTWSPVVPQLAKQYRLLIPDLAGHGESAPAEGPLPLQLILDKVSAIIDCEGIERATFVGNSMGGWISMLYTLANPQRVERLVLEDASGMAWMVTVPLFSRTREEAALALRAVHGPHTEIAEWMIDALLARATSSPMLRVAQAGVLPHLLDARLPELDVPVSLIWGADDGVLPVAYAEALRAKIKGS